MHTIIGRLDFSPREWYRYSHARTFGTVLLRNGILDKGALEGKGSSGVISFGKKKIYEITISIISRTRSTGMKNESCIVFLVFTHDFAFSAVL